MRSEQVLKAITSMIATDLDRRAESRIKFFLDGAVRGGWEAWLQVETAMALARAITPSGSPAAQRTYEVTREKTYPGGVARCDLHFVPVAGSVGVWIEFKTQREAGYAVTIADFYSDVQKLMTIDANQTVAAVAILVNDKLAWDPPPPALRMPAGSATKRYKFAAKSAAAGIEAVEVSAFDNVAAPLCIVWVRK